MKVGVHLPNDGKLSGEQFALIGGSGINLVKGLVRLDLPIGMDWSGGMTWGAISHALPGDAEIILRLYAPMQEVWSVGDFVNAAIPRVQNACSQIGQGRVWVEIHNEPNHPIEGFGPEGVERWRVWYTAVYQHLERAFRMLGLHQQVRLMWPGLSLGWAHRERVWARRCEEEIKFSDGLGVHCYWQSSHNPIDQVDRQLYQDRLGGNWKFYDDLCKLYGQSEKPIYVTEAGNSNCHNKKFAVLTPDQQADEYIRWCRDARRRVNGVVFYLLGGSEDWAGFRLYPSTVMALGALVREGHILQQDQERQLKEGTRNEA